ncbi:MAG: hypothetical protein HY423_12365 [Candidatus Lambdaproteobacteria bacterium]|nr:hypothetical protein [Candidatus Lambdaproteobacteria bacterium]
MSHDAKPARPPFAAWFAVALALLSAAGGAWAQEVEDIGEPPLSAAEYERYLSGLLARDTGRWLETVAELRAMPEIARQVLLYGLEERKGSPAPTRWRLFHHFQEFGAADDIPRLLESLPALKPGFERDVLLGTFWALRPASAIPLDLGLGVEEFSFLQTQPPAPWDPEHDLQLALTRRSFENFHTGSVPVSAIARMMPLRGQRFASTRELTDRLAALLGATLWSQQREKILAEVETIPKRLVQEGTLRLRLTNPGEVPLSLLVEFNAWYGRFEARPEPMLLYLPPRESYSAEFPVRLIGERQRPPVRIDLRIREPREAAAPVVRKLVLPEATPASAP